MNEEMKGKLEYDFEFDSWEVTLPNGVSGSGDTPQEAVDNLKFQANKHGLWPKENV